MKITFLGATKTVTGSKYLVTANSKKILVDCGLFQGYKDLRLKNWHKLPIDPAEIDAVILTHAHIDHSGYLPLLVKNGFKGQIYCTYGTKALCSILLPDSGYIHEEDAARANKYGYSKHHPALPLYTRLDAEYAMGQFHPLKFNQPSDILNTFTFTFYPAGHIIGSSLVSLRHKDINIVFTGDIGRPHHPIMKAPTIISQADYLVTESTYGDRLHDTTDPLDELERIINSTLAKQGSIIIPAFAVGRSQEMLYYIHQLKKSKRIPDIPVFLDSPMSQKVSNLLKSHTEEHKLDKDLCEQICNIAEYVSTPARSRELDSWPKPIIIISASGMIEGGRILHHLKAYLKDSKNTILLTGYQDPGTRGDRLLRGEPEIKIHGGMYPVKARIYQMKSLSAHADYRELLDWMRHFKRPPKKVFICHGDSNSTESLKTKITEELSWDCIIPDYLQEFDLR